MTEFRLTFKTDNAAFEESGELEIARILRDVADRVESGVSGATVRDVNGNRVGAFDVHGTERLHVVYVQDSDGNTAEELFATPDRSMALGVCLALNERRLLRDGLESHYSTDDE